MGNECAMNGGNRCDKQSKCVNTAGGFRCEQQPRPSEYYVMSNYNQRCPKGFEVTEDECRAEVVKHLRSQPSLVPHLKFDRRIKWLGAASWSNVNPGCSVGAAVMSGTTGTRTDDSTPAGSEL